MRRLSAKVIAAAATVSLIAVLLPLVGAGPALAAPADPPYDFDETTAPSPRASDGTITGTVTDRHTTAGIEGLCVFVTPFGDDTTLVADTMTDASGFFSVAVPAGTYQVLYLDCVAWDYGTEWFGITQIEPIVVDPTGTADASFDLTTTDLPGLFDVNTGKWYLAAPRNDIVTEFYYGDPGDLPMMGDWDCDGVDTPGLYRQSDGYVYLRNSNTQGNADISFFFGDPGDVPLAGDFDGDCYDTVSIYRPSEARFYIINELGADNAGLGKAEFDYVFGDLGDTPFVGDFDFDGVDTVGLHRESTGMVYFRNSHTQGIADELFIFGDPGDRVVAGHFSTFWASTPACYRPSDLTFYFRHTNTQGNADRTNTWESFAGSDWLPVVGVYGLS